MIKILHLSAECYPAAKAGGLGDVVGALPKYLHKAGQDAAVIIPKYHTKWMMQQSFETVYRGVIRLHHEHIPFAIEQLSGSELGFPLLAIHIPGKFDRPGIYADPGGYGYGDEVTRYLCFQQAALHWIMQLPQKPDVLHCHDHHTGLIPFMIKHCQDYRSLADIPTVFTIHNGEYHGAFSWRNMHLLPYFDASARGLLDWQNTINPLASAIKCCWQLTTVSPSYMEELRHNSHGLEWLLNNEHSKSKGILNGIDTQVWNPKTDKYLPHQLKGNRLEAFKAANKKIICEHFGFQLDRPLFTFIGRLVSEKGADLLPDTIGRFLGEGQQASFMILGTGQQHLHYAFGSMSYYFGDRFNAALEYNESLAHLLYAGSDFLLMPSRVEPCGLNQMYAMRYATVPIVRSVGGLKDTIIDAGVPKVGRGFRFDHFTVEDAMGAMHRAMGLFANRTAIKGLRKRIAQVDYSWERSAAEYIDLYSKLIKK